MRWKPVDGGGTFEAPTCPDMGCRRTASYRIRPSLQLRIESITKAFRKGLLLICHSFAFVELLEAGAASVSLSRFARKTWSQNDSTCARPLTPRPAHIIRAAHVPPSCSAAQRLQSAAPADIIKRQQLSPSRHRHRHGHNPSVFSLGFRRMRPKILNENEPRA